MNSRRFVAEAVPHELDRRRLLELHRSLQNPHPDSTALAKQGMDEWAQSLPEEDIEALVDASAGKAVRWLQGEGWVDGSE